MELRVLINPKTSTTYPMTLVLLVSNYSSAAWYGGKTTSSDKIKKGPKPFLDDDQALEAIKVEITKSRFHSEGYIKLSKRLKKSGVIVAKNRVNVIMRENQLLSAQRPVKQGARRKHDGTIITQKPNVLWGTDGKQFFTEQEGMCWLFSVIDHYNDEILGYHICKVGNRFAAMEPIKQAVKKEFGSINENICKGTNLAIRSDHGTQYDSADFVNEMKFIGLTESKSFVRSPECNGMIERWHRTLNEQIIEVNAFESLKQAIPIISQFIEDYNKEWILHRFDCQSPIEIKNNYYKQLKKCA